MRLIYTNKAAKELSKLDKFLQNQIKKYMDKIQNLDDPRSKGKALTGNLAGLWRYRVSDYRVLCRIEDKILTIFAIKISHRKDVYDD